MFNLDKGNKRAHETCMWKKVAFFFNHLNFADISGSASK